MNRARFSIVGAVNQSLNSGVHQGSGTHRARFNCSKQSALSQTMIAQRRARLTQGDDFRMGRRIGVFNVTVPSAANDSIAAYDDGANGDFLRFERALRFPQGFLHP